MRWSVKHYPFPQRGEMRDCKGFLFLPKMINGEWRWLEYAIWWEQYDPTFGWVPDKWR